MEAGSLFHGQPVRGRANNLLADGFYGVEVGEAVEGVGFEVAAFGPFIPAVDVKDAEAVGFGEEALFGHFEGGAEVFGGVVLDGVHEGVAAVIEGLGLVGARAGVPAHGDVGDVKGTPKFVAA